MIHSKVVLKEMNKNDWEDIHRYASLPIVCQYQPWGPNTEEETQAFVKQVLWDTKKENRSRYVFSVFEQENRTMIGAGEINFRDFRVGEIGYIIHPDYWGKGIATEVAKLLLQFGFEKLNLHRIYATCDPRNVGSSKVLQKIGMIQEGRMREDLLLKTGWRDSLLYSILEQEWNEVNKTNAPIQTS